jgi:hypothetical protein
MRADRRPARALALAQVKRAWRALSQTRQVEQGAASNMKPALASTVTLLVAGCQVTVSGGSHSAPTEAGVPVISENARTHALATADLSRAIPVWVELRDQGFAPEVVRLAVGQPSRLTVQRIGGVGPHAC